ncbi:MAG: phasin family protein [Alphaproteobacteria bacterium]|nr:phasin family protein [Alphaproteobacteria bacterium]
MSRPASNPFLESDFGKLMDMSKIMGEFKIPSFNMEAVFAAARRNIEVAAAVNQAAFETAQLIARRQAEWMRQGFEESASLMNAVIATPSPEEKVIRQAEASKAAMEKCMANMRDIAETISRCQTQTMETVSNRMAESVEELRGIIRNGNAAA